MTNQNQSIPQRNGLLQRLDSASNFLESRPIALAAALSFFYILLLVMPIQRRLWHDELFTYYIAGARDFQSFLFGIHNIDLNPPMVYFVTRGWQSIFGSNEMVTRVPSAIAFLIASLAAITFLSRRIGWLWASCACVLFWASPNFVYATELRPYALLLMFYSLMLLAWDAAQLGSKYRMVALGCLLLAAVGLMLCHVFAIFLLGALYLAQLVRSVRERRIDWAVWIVLLLPLAVVPSYFVSSETFESSVFPPRFQGGVRRLIFYWGKSILAIGIPFAVSAAATFVVRRPSLAGIASSLRSARPGDLGLWCGLMMIPFLINAVLMRTHGAFFERYALGTTFAISLTAVLAVGSLSGFSRPASLMALLTLLMSAFYGNFIHQPRSGRDRSAFVSDRIHSDLPFVAASGLTFLEMDHYEKPDFLSHVFYLTDRASAIRYSNAVIFESMGNLKKHFPIRANVESYNQFVAEHPHFLVFGTIAYPEDWLLRKLIQEGATVKPISFLKDLAYKDNDVYEVFMAR